MCCCVSSPGVLVPPSWGLSIFATRVVPQLIAPERVIFKKWGQHFAQWNPTQVRTRSGALRAFSVQLP